MTSGPSTPEPLRLDLGDFDAIGVMGEVVGVLRAHAIQADVDTMATVSAPEGWHAVHVTARRSGHVTVGVRYAELTTSRWHNVTKALAGRGWLLDEDQDGATLRFPPGTEPTTPAFEVLSVLTLAGAPTDVRQVTAHDTTGTPIPLTPTNP